MLLVLLCIMASCSSLMAPAASMWAMNSSGFTLSEVASIISMNVAALHCSHKVAKLIGTTGMTDDDEMTARAMNIHLS